MVYELVEDKLIAGAWRVEGINFDGDAEVYVTIFVGPNAQNRAQEYLQWQSA
jgi:hypothetical protein